MSSETDERDALAAVLRLLEWMAVDGDFRTLRSVRLAVYLGLWEHLLNELFDGGLPARFLGDLAKFASELHPDRRQQLALLFHEPEYAKRLAGSIDAAPVIRCLASLIARFHYLTPKTGVGA